MTLHELATMLGGSINGKWLNIPGPGHSTADRSLGICFDPAAKDGFVVYSLSGDDEEGCRKHVKQLLSGHSNGDVAAPPAAINENEATLKKIKAASKLWSHTANAPTTIVETYLTSRKCITGDWDTVIRFHPDCPFGHVSAPAMVALIQNVLTGEPQGVHRTALSNDGKGKRVMPVGMGAKMMLGAVRDGAVTLAQTGPHLGIAEGIETGLSAQKTFGIPTWAVLSATGIGHFPIIAGVKHLTVFADNDHAGLKAAHACARRYLKAGINGEIRYPAEPGEDWNDFLRAQENEHE